MTAGPAGGSTDFFISPFGLSVASVASVASVTSVGTIFPLALGLAIPPTGRGECPSATVAGPVTGLVF